MKRILATITLFAAATIAHAQQQIAFTWDDLPAHGSLAANTTRTEIGQRIIAASKAAHLPAPYGFVNGIRAVNEPTSEPMLDEWRKAGFHLGNHTWSHMNLNTSSIADWESDTLKNEPILEEKSKLGKGKNNWHWLRYPYLAEGDTPEKRTAARTWLAQHGYHVAPVTTDFADFLYNEPYVRCVAKNDTASIEILKQSYLDTASADIDYTRSLAQKLYGHDIPYVLLMHIGALDSILLPQLIEMYRSKGFQFVSLEEATKHPFYKNAIDPTLPAAPDTLEEAMWTQNIPVPKRPGPTVDLEKICR